MTYRIAISFICAHTLLAGTTCYASPWNLPQELTGQNTKILFEVDAPWNILDGTANEVSGKVSLANSTDPGSLSADISVQSLDYKPGISVAGRLVAVWLRENTPTPAKFAIGKSSLDCTPQTISAQSPCKGSVEGQLTIWAKEYTIDVPIEMKQTPDGFVLTGDKKIKWGEYGFGDPSATIAHLKPEIALNFSIELKSATEVASR